jgi:hypothetical protein
MFMVVILRQIRGFSRCRATQRSIDNAERSGLNHRQAARNEIRLPIAYEHPMLLPQLWQR